MSAQHDSGDMLAYTLKSTSAKGSKIAVSGQCTRKEMQATLAVLSGVKTDLEKELLAALQSLHRICLNCDAEREDSNAPTEDEYDAAMNAAEAAIARATGGSA